jgi:2-methylcitrate dehydratase
MDATTRRLARYALATDFPGLPAVAVHECRRRLIDSFACAAAAYEEPFCANLRVLAGRYAGTPSARIWGSAHPTSIEMAAFVNGTMVRYLDCSDTWLGKAAGHPSDMIGALVAAAEAYRRDGASLATATVVAYEIYCGLCDSIALQAHGVDQATCAAAGTAMGVGRLLGLDETQLCNALSLALASNVNLYNVRCGELSDWKGCAGANGARNGVFAALLAKDGMRGPTAVIEGKGGLFEVVGEFEWQVAARQLPLIVATHLKFHPVCYHGQSAIDAALALRERVVLDDVVEIQVETYDTAYRAMAADPQRWAPTNRETADHSLPYTIAVALEEGRLTPAAYAQQRLGSSKTRQLMDKIKVSSSTDMSAAFPASAPARIRIAFKDGTALDHWQQHPKGNASNPLSDAELESKFLGQCAPWGGREFARRAIDAMWEFDRLPDVTMLTDTVCAAS